MKLRQWLEKNSIWLINAGYMFALIVVVTPLLILGKYNYPSADDWSFGAVTYQIARRGGGFFDVLAGALEVVRDNYINWEGRYSIPFFGALQPGIWGEQYYAVTVWLMLGMLILSELVLAAALVKDKEGCNKRLVIPIVVPALLVQILCVKYPDESFFWYNGSMTYTFMYGLSLIFVAVFLKVADCDKSTIRTWLLRVIAVILAVILGGTNFATSLSTILLMALLLAYYLLTERKKFARTWYLFFVSLAGLLVSIFSPAVEQRLNANFGGETGSAVDAVILSFVRTFWNFYSWTDGKVLICLVLIAPFLWKAMKQMECKFRWPGVFSILTFGVYASQMTATLYVDGSTGGGRMGAILYYAYFVWIIANVGYWFGWLSRKERLRLVDICSEWIYKRCIMYCAIAGAAFVCLIGVTELKDTTFYKAYRSLKQGWAQDYAKAWQERFVLLHDDSVRELRVELLDNYPEMIVYTDIQEEYLWVNEACANYYGKDYIGVLNGETK